MRTISLAVVMLVLAGCGKQPAHRTATYVDARQCQGCHSAIDRHYRHTGMAQSLYRPDSSNTPSATYFHAASATYYSILSRDGKFFERRWQKGYQGREENVEELQIDLCVGSGHKVRTYLHRTSRGTLIELPLAWYSEKGGRWAMNPGYDTAAPDMRRKIGYDCMFCHNTYPAIPPGHDTPGSEPVFSGDLPEGIDCQRCHGPGSEHVLVAQAPGASKQKIRAAILNPSRLPPARQMEVCMQCHLETTSHRLPNAIKRFERGPYSYRPDEPLGQFMLFFDHAPGTGHEGKFEIVNSVYRLRQSRCFLESAGKLTCVRCHDPHDIPRGEAAATHYRAVCRECHGAALDTKIAAGAHPRDPDCTGCHMPRRRTEDVVHAVMTDHLIQRMKPARDLVAEMTEPHETDETSYRGRVVPYYGPFSEKDALYTAVAQVAEKSNLVGGRAQLSAEIDKQHPTQVEFSLALGDAWRDSAEPRRAAEQYDAVLKRDPNRAAVAKRLGVALKDAGESARAAEVLRKAAEANPSDAALWFELGTLDSDQARSAQAVAELEKAVALDPDLGEAYENLGVALAESGAADRAEAAFRNALRIRPYDARIYANLGRLLATQKNAPDEAIYCYERALAMKPEDASAHFDFGVILARLNRLDAARAQVQAAIRYDPKLAEAHDVLGGMSELAGQMGPAEREYREALRLKPGLARTHLNLGALLAAKGNRKEAVEQLTVAAASGDAQVAEQAREELRTLRGN